MIDYQSRRQRFAGQLMSNSIAIIPGGIEQLRNGDAHYRFCQDSNFYYLTGFEEPESILVVISDASIESILFNRARIPAEEQWTGIRLGQAGALSVLGMDYSFSIQEFEKRLPELLLGKEQIYFPLGKHPLYEKILFESWERVKNQHRKGIQAPSVFIDVAPILGEMRLFKDENELAFMKEAARISVQGHQRAMRACKHLTMEYELEAEFVYEITKQGCRGLAYDSIVAAGANACILHYTANDQRLKPNHLVLVDAGGEFNHYAADITRTYPVNGRFSSEQQMIYELVLQAQRAGIEKIKPGTSWVEIQLTMIQILTQGLMDLKILKGDTAELIRQEAYKPYYMHSSGHWLGLDVHDVGAYKVNQQWRSLKANMVLTVEPGLYFSPDLPNIDERWKGIGVRIEDDILVTAQGYENLTQALPVQVKDIEDLMRD